MSDEEDFDEFPSITVNSSMHESSSFSMPSAEQLAQQRAREDACQRALRRLRSQSSEGATVAALSLSDSSGSEGEAALAAAAGAPPPPPAPPAASDARRLLLALRDAAGPAGAALFDAHLAALEAGGRPAAARAARAAARLRALAAGAWDTDEALGAAAWLCAACARPPAPRGARPALHALLEGGALPAARRERLGAALGGALRPEEALELADALRAGGGARARRLAARLLRAALPAAGAVRGEGPPPPPADHYRALQLLARLQPEGGQAEGEGGEERRRLAALLHAAARHKDRSADALKVLVAASKLQVLFGPRPAPDV